MANNVAERALHSLDIAGAISQPSASQRKACSTKPAAHRSLRGALQMLLEAEGSATYDRQLKVMLGRLSEVMLEGISVYSWQGEITYANDNLCHMLGHTRDELIGKPAAQYFGQIYPRSRQAALSAGRATLRERYETELCTKAGRSLVVDVCSEGIKGASGKHLGWFAVMIDITARANALRQWESEARLLSAQFMAAQELERQRIARELHDSIGQALGGLKFGLESCESLIAAGSCDAAARTMRQLAGRIQCVVDEVRRISMNLRPSTLDDLGILPTLGWFTREFRAIYDQLELEILVDICEEEIAVPVKTAIYRIVQEAFNNVVTHSAARKVSLVLRRRGSHIELQVRDDGAGFDPARFSVADESGRGLGLATMRERAEVTGGRFSLQSESGRGTTVGVMWPSYRTRVAGDAASEPSGNAE